MHIHDFLLRLEPQRKRRDGQGNYLCCCPAHDDSTESLHVKLGRNKKGQDIILIKCLAGCTREEILQAMGLKQKDLTCDSAAADPPPWEEGRVHTARPTYEKKPQKKADHGEKRLEAAYPYTDEDGQLLFEAVRYRYADGTKTFRQRRPDPDHPGQWLWELSGVRLVLYRLPGVLAAIREKRPVWIVEGEKDADNLAQLGLAATSSPMGAGKWSKGDYKGSLQGAACYILPDNDDPGWQHARDIAQSLDGVAENARILDLRKIWPELPKKGDVSDLIGHLGGEKAREALLQAAQDRNIQWADLPELYAKIPGYCAMAGHICQVTDSGTKALCNFLALPVSVLTVDDGINQIKTFEIRGWSAHGKELPTARVPVAQFAGMSWVQEKWEFAANIAPGNQVKDKLRYVIAEVGRMTVERRTEYAHTGWRKIGTHWAYLHGGGAIGAEKVNTLLEGGLGRFRLEGGTYTAREGYLASRGLMQVMAPHVAVPLLCSVYLAPLRSFLMDVGIPPSFAVFFVGKNGTLKTSAVALGLCHFGKFSSKTPVASFHDTANSVRMKAFALKDMLLQVDDYHPTSSQQERRKMETMAQDLARAFGDNADRGRMNADRTLQTAMPPRCLALMTGEDLPQIGESGLARFFQVRVREGDVPITDRLTAAQDAAAEGLLQASMIGYIEYLRKQGDDLPQKLKTEWLKLRQTARERLPDTVHARNIEATAHLMLGWELFLLYGYTLGAIDEAALNSEIELAWQELIRSGQTQTQEAQEDTPVNRYLDSLRELLNSKIAYVVNVSQITAGAGNAPGMIGYCDDKYYYLMPELCYKAINEVFIRQGSQFPLSNRGVMRALKEAGITETDGNGVTKNKWIGGRAMRLLWIRRHMVDGGEPPAEQTGFLEVDDADDPFKGEDKNDQH